jgi:hypothetical protein
MASGGGEGKGFAAAAAKLRGKRVARTLPPPRLRA